jgi:hypothetical protein
MEEMVVQVIVITKRYSGLAVAVVHHLAAPVVQVVIMHMQAMAVAQVRVQPVVAAAVTAVAAAVTVAALSLVPTLVQVAQAQTVAMDLTEATVQLVHPAV